MYQENSKLLEEINERKSKLYESAKEKGLTSEETVKHSQELDKLIFQYQRKIHKNPKRQEEKKSALQKMMLMIPSFLAEV